MSKISERVFMQAANYASMFGIGGISQSVAGDVVRRCADPSLTDAQFEELVREVQSKGYQLQVID